MLLSLVRTSRLPHNRTTVNRRLERHAAMMPVDHLDLGKRDPTSFEHLTIVTISSSTNPITPTVYCYHSTRTLTSSGLVITAACDRLRQLSPVPSLLLGAGHRHKQEPPRLQPVSRRWRRRRRTRLHNAQAQANCQVDLLLSVGLAMMLRGRRRRDKSIIVSAFVVLYTFPEAVTTRHRSAC